MASLPTLITARDLLDQLADSLRLKPGKSRLADPCDCEYMSLLTDATNPFPLHLVNGAGYLEWVRKYGYYFSMGLGMKTAFVCVESKPIAHLLSLVALASGIPKADLLMLSVSRSHFEALNRAFEQICVSNPIFCEQSQLDLDGLIALIRHLRKHEGIEAVIVDSLHRVRSDGDTPATRVEQRQISSVVQSTAHVGKLTVVAGFYDPEVEFPNLAADSVFHCGPEGDQAVKAEPRRIAMAGLAMAMIRRMRVVFRSLFRRNV